MKFIEVESLYYDEVKHNRPIYVNADDISYVMSTCNVPKFEDARTIVMKDGTKHIVADKYSDIINKLVKVNINREDTDNDWK